MKPHYMQVSVNVVSTYAMVVRSLRLTIFRSLVSKLSMIVAGALEKCSC